MELIDLTFLQSFTGGNKEKIAKYINLFLQACPDQLAKMNERLAERDYPSDARAQALAASLRRDALALPIPNPHLLRGWPDTWWGE